MKHLSYVSLSFSRSYKSKVEDRDRHLKSQRNKKLGFNCTASLQVNEYDDHVSATYFNNHSLSVDSLGHLPFPMTVKENIAGVLSTIVFQGYRISFSNLAKGPGVL